MDNPPCVCSVGLIEDDITHISSALLKLLFKSIIMVFLHVNRKSFDFSYMLQSALISMQKRENGPPQNVATHFLSLYSL